VGNTTEFGATAKGVTEPLVETASGTLRGTVAGDEIYVFKGVPYGAPTGGKSRFRAPGPPPQWNGIRDASAYGPSCPQPFGATSGPPIDEQDAARRHMFGVYGMPLREEDQDEDCLVLNIWTPSVSDDVSRPVMVRIHGGAFVMGSGSWKLHDGTALSSRGDVVVVTVNHRLGVLGYLNLAELSATDYADSGNAGMLDLVAALSWVHDNIASFGGDPSNVTVFGESGGGYKITALLSMPAARGLFHRAIIESGPGLKVKTQADGTESAVELLAELGLAPDQVDRLAELPVDQLMKAQSALAERAGMASLLTWAPVLDPNHLPRQPEDALADGSGADVPLLIGTNKDEATMFLLVAGIGPETPVGEEMLGAALTLTIGDQAEEVLSSYRTAQPDATALDLLVAIQSDQMMRVPSIRLVEYWLEGGRKSPAFMYLLAWESPAMNGFVRATHGLDVPLTMDNVDDAPMTADYPASRLVASQMSEAWIHFARHGDPNHNGIPAWPAYQVPERMTMVFDCQSNVVADPFGQNRAAWEGVPLQP
jgi:para-nitrobenzyl esterase